jgi:succinyl-diaminopimelate desuccinylase
VSKTLELAQQLIKIDSITPDDKGCQAIMSEQLSQAGFEINPLKFGDVDNFWATHGANSPVFMFAGHTDVVPVGDLSQWDFPPFSAQIKEGLLFGRGAADMKGSLAAMLSATARFVADYPNHRGTIAYLITSDEEGAATNGTVKVCEHLNNIGQKVDYCLVGEPSSTTILGDVIKNGRRGSLNGVLKIIGKQGHIAYPHLAKNPIHLAVAAMDDLCQECWDKGNEYFPATSFQMSNIHAGAGVTNVIPGTVEIVFNFRYSSESTFEDLQTRVVEILDKRSLNYTIDWTHSGYPFLTPKGDLVSSCVDAIQSVVGIEAQLSTTGGTSDGRFIAPMLGAQVVELGPINASIHQINENVAVQDLDDLSDIYYHILKNMLT